MLRPAVLAALLIAITTWAYSTSFRGVFVYDDGGAIVENPNIRSLWPLTSAMSAPPESPVSARPVASLTLALNHALAPADVRDVMTPSRVPGGVDERFLRNVWGYHAMNLVLHLCTALVIAGVVRRTLMTPRMRERFGGAATLLGFCAATIWAVHPLTTDAVTYIAQRTEVLMGLAFALTLYSAIRAADGPQSSRGSRLWTMAAVVACVAGMGSKQTMVTAPVAVMLWDRIFLSPSRAPDAGGRSRLLYAGLASSWLVLGALVAYERWPTSIGFALQGWTPWTYLLTQTTVIAHYARLVLLGSPLALDYDGWPMSRSVLAVLPYAIPLAALLALTTIGTIRRRPWAFPLVIVFAALAPSSSVLPLATEIVAERRMYVPLAALVILAVVAGFALLKRVSAPAAGRIAACATVVVVIATYGSMTHARNQDFWSAERIWRDTVEKRPDNPRARLNYGVQLADQGRLMEAVPELREAIRLKESSGPAHLNLGAMLCSLGQLDEGIFHLERALQLDSSYTQAYRNLGEAYGSLGNRAMAARYFDLAVTDRPDDAFLLNRLGWLLATSPEPAVRNASKAVEIAERAVRVTSRQDPTSLDTLAAAYAEADRFEEAAAAAAEAVALAGRRGDRDLLGELARRQALYSARQKYREPGR